MALSICAEARGSPLRRRLCLLLEGATGRGREAGFCLVPDRGKISPFLVNGRYKLVCGFISQGPEISCRRERGSRFTAGLASPTHTTRQSQHETALIYLTTVALLQYMGFILMYVLCTVCRTVPFGQRRHRYLSKFASLQP